MDLSQITKIVELMSKHDLTEIDIKSDELALTIKRERDDGPAPQQIALPSMPAVAPSPVAPAAPPAPAVPSVQESDPAAPPPPAGNKPADTIDSPLVGTFYSSPSPDAEPYVQAGDKVKADTVVCIVEAMKVLNEIKAERAGVIRQVLVENSQPVEFGQPLFEIDPL